MQPASSEQHIGTVDVRELQTAVGWPLLRLLAPRFVEEIELGRFMRGLLATHRWAVVRVVPHVDEQGQPSRHVFDVYGQPA